VDAGYQVTVVDPVPEHVSAAARLPGVRAVLGDARDLPAGDGCRGLTFGKVTLRMILALVSRARFADFNQDQAITVDGGGR